jgi:CBS domain containing-hemolysin-like protein
MSDFSLLNDALCLVACALCLTGAAVAAVLQIALRALGKERTRELLKAGGVQLKAWLEAPMRLLISMLMARILLVAVAAWLLSVVFQGAALKGAPMWAMVGVPLAHICIGEVILGTWAKHRAERAVQGALRLFAVVDALLWVPSWLLSALARHMAGALSGGDPHAKESGPFLTEDDMARLWGLAPQAGKPPDQGHRLLQGVMQFQDAVVRDVMVSRGRMTALDVDANQDDILSTFSRQGHGRLPVYQGNMDHVVGVLFLADVLRAQTSRQSVNVRASMRRPYFVPELMRIGDLLREFQKRRTHMAVVVDEFGTTSGLVTLQDVVQKIVGDVRDEDDVQDPSMRALGNGRWLMDGRTSVAAVSAALGVDLPANGTYETLGGFLITVMGRLPQPGATVKTAACVLTVKEADEKRVTKVEVEKINPE